MMDAADETIVTFNILSDKIMSNTDTFLSGLTQQEKNEVENVIELSKSVEGDSLDDFENN